MAAGYHAVYHPASLIPFDDLYAGLMQEVAAGNIYEKKNGALSLFTYSQQCTYDGNWNLFTASARGLIVDTENRQVVAYTFPKFFNLSENKTTIPDLPFVCSEKVDGSLIIVYCYDGEWRTATKGSFDSDQAKWALKYIRDHDMDVSMLPDRTYLFEAVYPENRIVIRYPDAELVLLGSYHKWGYEFPTDNIKTESEFINARAAKTYQFGELAAIIDHAKTLPSSEEGYVLRYDDGTRVKIKGDEYCRIHRMISNITPLAIWESMKNGDNLDFIRKEIPEEFWEDFDTIRGLLTDKLDTILSEIKEVHNKTKHLVDKDVGLMLNTFTPCVKTLIFPFRKLNGDMIAIAGDKRFIETIYRIIRPNGNSLEGYHNSIAMNRIQSEML